MKNLLIFIFILLLLSVLNNKEFFINEKKWKNYRLGDIIRGYFTNNINNKNIKYLKNLNKKYKNSLGHKYYQKTKGKENLNELFKLIENESKKLKLKFDICMHIRLGDVIIDGDNPHILPEKYKDKPQYNYSLDTYNKLFYSLKSNYNVNKILIFGGGHRKLNKKQKNESNKFILNIKKLCINNNINTEFRLGNNPDEDFLLMSNSKIFIKTGGGYSQTISDYVSYKNNLVINPQNYQ